PAQHHDADGEEQREGNGGADDDGAAQVAQEYPLQEEDQGDADDHVVQDRVRGDVDQVLAVVDALDAHARRQHVRVVDALHLLMDALDGGRALLAAAHEDDALHDVVGLVLAGDAEPGTVTDGDGGDVAHQHRVAAALGQHGVAEVLHAADEPDATHHGDLRPDVDRIAADIDVAVAQRLQQLRQREAVGHELVEVDLQLVGLGLAAPAGDVDDARNGAEAALQHPVLQGLEVEHAVAGRPDETVAVDLADGAGGRDLRLHVVGQLRQLRQAVEHLLQRLLVGVVERELKLHVGQAIERYRADGLQVADAGGLRLDRDGDVALDLLGREPGALRD